MAARVEAGVAGIGEDGAGREGARAFRQIHRHDVVVFEDRAFEHVAVDVPGIGIGHEQRVGADIGAVVAEHVDLTVGEIERLRLRVLEQRTPRFCSARASPIRNLRGRKLPPKRSMTPPA